MVEIKNNKKIIYKIGIIFILVISIMYIYFFIMDPYFVPFNERQIQVLIFTFGIWIIFSVLERYKEKW